MEERIHASIRIWRLIVLLRTAWVAESILRLFELFEHILVVQKSVREFFLEQVISEILLDALLNDWHVQNAVDTWSLTRIFLQAHLDDIF